MGRLCVAFARPGSTWRTAPISVQLASRRHESAFPATATVTAAAHSSPSTTSFDCSSEPAPKTIRYIRPGGSWHCTRDCATEGSWLTSSASLLASLPVTRTVTGPEGDEPAIAPAGTDVKPVTSATDGSLV